MDMIAIRVPLVAATDRERASTHRKRLNVNKMNFKEGVGSDNGFSSPGQSNPIRSDRISSTNVHM
jgi:hypothetical protein